MAAASVIASRGDTAQRTNSRANNGEIRILPLADEKDWEARHELGMLMLDGTWHSRTVLWTSEVLQFARPGEQVVVDMIPLHEILSVTEMNDEIVHSKRKLSAQILKLDFHDSSSGPPTRGHFSRFQIKTIADGFNSGRTYYLQAASDTDRDLISGNLSKSAHKASRRVRVKTRFQKIQSKVKKVQSSFLLQIFVALLIVLNFVVNAAESQLSNSLFNGDGSLSATGKVLEQLDTFFTIMFTIELALNIFANWFSEFINDGWNLFDLIVVILSLVALGPISMPINVLRSIRAFRAVRIFGRLAALRDIVCALTVAIIPVLNACLILLVVASIYSILGSTFFGQSAPDNFAKFDIALLSMFRLTAGMGWFDSLPATDADGSINVGAVCFVASYVVIVNWTLLQVMVAVLLDSFITSRSQAVKDRDLISREERADRSVILNTLDPLLEKLACDYIDDTDLQSRLEKLFKVLDADESGGLSDKEFSMGIKKLDFHPHIHVSESEFAVFTQNGALCNARGQLGMDEFAIAMRNQIQLYFQRRLSNALVFGSVSRNEMVQLGTLKALYLEQIKVQQEQHKLGKEHMKLEQGMQHLQVEMINVGSDIRELMSLIRSEKGTKGRSGSYTCCPNSSCSESRRTHSAESLVGFVNSAEYDDLGKQRNAHIEVDGEIRKGQATPVDLIELRRGLSDVCDGQIMKNTIRNAVERESNSTDKMDQNQLRMGLALDESSTSKSGHERSETKAIFLPYEYLNFARFQKMKWIRRKTSSIQSNKRSSSSEHFPAPTVSKSLKEELTQVPYSSPESPTNRSKSLALRMKDSLTNVPICSDKLGLEDGKKLRSRSKVYVNSPTAIGGQESTGRSEIAVVKHGENKVMHHHHPNCYEGHEVQKHGATRMQQISDTDFQVKADMTFMSENIVAFTVERHGQLVVIPNSYNSGSTSHTSTRDNGTYILCNEFQSPHDSAELSKSINLESSSEFYY